MNKSTILYCYKKNVEEENQKRLDELILGGSEEKIYKFKIKGLEKVLNEDLNFFENMKMKDLKLCKGARVMHLVNDSARSLWNGSTGIVENVFDEYVEVLFEKGANFSYPRLIKIYYYNQSYDYYKNKTKQVVCRSFIPLALSWAMTIHKAQGSTLTNGILSLMAFASGQVYTAISRFQDLNNLWITSFYKEKIIVDENCKLFYENLKN